MKSKTKIVNLIGGPGVGKSTTAARVFSELKAKNVSCELVTELAKDITWEDTKKLLDNQIWLFSEQFRRQWRLLDKVDFVITDSPLIMYIEYLERLQKKLPDTLKFSPMHFIMTKKFFQSTFEEFWNLNFIIEREFDYIETGRNQTKEEAIELDQAIIKRVKAGQGHFLTVPAKSDTPLHPITKYILNVHI